MGKIPVNQLLVLSVRKVKTKTYMSQRYTGVGIESLHSMAWLVCREIEAVLQAQN